MPSGELTDPQFLIIDRYFWIAFIAAATFYGVVQWRNVRRKLSGDPDATMEYGRYFGGYFFWANIPWVLMGLGILIGKVGGISDYLKPAVGNEWVLAWFAILALILIAGTLWIFVGRGAEALSAHPEMPFVPYLKPFGMKLVWLLFVAINVAGFFVAYYFGPAGSREGKGGIPEAFFLLGFVCIWILFNYMLSFWSGWDLLEEFYRYRGEERPRMRLGRGDFGKVHYSMLILGADGENLHMSVFFLFRAGHPNLAIPWRDIKVVEKKGFIGRHVHFTFAKAPMVRLKISRHFASRLGNHLAQRLQVPPESS